MSTYEEIKPQQNLRNALAKVFNGYQLRHMEGVVRSFVLVTLASVGWVQEIQNADSALAESIEVAQSECRRIGESVQMALGSALNTTFTLSNGHDGLSQLEIMLDRKDLNKGFTLSASGAFKKDPALKRFRKLETFSCRNVVVPHEQRLTLDLQWSWAEGVPQIQTWTSHRVATVGDEWLLMELENAAPTLISQLNSKIQELAGRSA
jgi:hypothetical protein